VADLSEGGRGQLLLVTALVLAVVFVSLSIVVNAAIYSENIASRQDPSGTDALQGRHETAVMAVDLLASVNRENNTDNATLGEGVRGGLDETDEFVRLERAKRGSLTNTTLQTSSQNNGTIVYQNESRELTSAEGNADWTVVRNVNRRAGGNGTRAFTMNLTSISGDLRILVADYSASDIWGLTVFGNVSAGNDVTVEVDSPVSSTKNCTKTLDSGHAEIDVTGGTVAGEPCGALRGSYRFAHGVGDRYNISVKNGDQATGNYSLVTRNATAWKKAASDSDFQLNYTKASGGAPYARAAIYNTTVVYEYRSSELVYETKIRVAPGEPDD
jgi:hypothetical protein